MPKRIQSSLQEQRGGSFGKGLTTVGILFVLVWICVETVAAKGQVPGAASKTPHPSFEVRSVGSGPAILMIPGLSSGASTWDGTVDALKGRFRCITIGVAGFAGVAPVPGLTLEMVRDQLAGYIRSEHLQRPILMGHSLGGAIAMDLAARYPTLVGPVVVVDALPFMAEAWFEVPTLDAAKPFLAQMGAGMRAMSAAQWAAYQQSGATTRTMASSPADQKRLMEWGLASDQKTVTDTMLELLGEDLRGELKQIQTPVLVIGTWAGLQSPGVTKESVKRLFLEQYAGVHDLDLVMADKERHFVMWDNPNWFEATLEGFLSRNSVAAADAAGQ